MKIIRIIVINILLSLLFIGCSGSGIYTYDKEGFNSQGYNRVGHDRKGFDRAGFNYNGYDIDGYNEDGYTSLGYSKLGYDRSGYDVNGYNKLGFNKNGYDKAGYDKDGISYKGFDIEGYDKNGFNPKGYNKNGLNKNGVSEKSVKKLNKRKINKLISSSTTIAKVFNNTLKTLKKDKYESALEYTDRIKNKENNTHFTMEVDIKGRYNPESKMYELVFLASNNLTSPFFKYKQGNLDYGITLNPFSFQATSLSYLSKATSWKDQGSNAYGYTTEVDNTLIEEYVIFPDNLSQIVDYNEYIDLKLIEDNSHACAPLINSGRFSKYKDTMDPSSCNNKYDVILSIPISKKLAKKYDKKYFKLKLSAKLIDINNSMYHDVSSKSATIDSPYSYSVTSYISRAHIDTIVIYNKNTKKILYQYID